MGGSDAQQGDFIGEGCCCWSSQPLPLPSPASASTGPWRRPPPLPAGALEEWKRVLQPEDLIREPSVLQDYATIQPNSSYYPSPPSPQALLRPRSTEQVSEVLRVANKFGVPVISYAGGTSLEGQVLFSEGGVCVDLCHMDKVLQVHEKDLEVTLQPAVGWVALNRRLEPLGLMLGVDPGLGARIGGMVGTNCSGPHAFRWGNMRQSVVNLTVVLADGTVMRTRQRPRKTSAGYDLTGLFVGAEGTLGIITEATLRLQQVPRCMEVARVCFESVRKAAEAVQDIKLEGLSGLLCCEFLCARAIRSVNAYSKTVLPEAPTLLMKFGGSSKEVVAAEVARVRTCCARHTSAPFEFSTTPQEREELWLARKNAGHAAAAFGKPRRLSITDTAVPLSRVADYIEAVEVELSKSWLSKTAGENCFIAHLGDGNVHCNFPFDPDSPEELAEAYRLNKELVQMALKMEGTCSGEHGVGLGKRAYLQEELGAEALQTMRLIKRALDPKGIMNPGKVIPSGPDGQPRSSL